MLGHRCEKLDGEAIGCRKIDYYEFDPGFHKIEDKGNVPGEPVQLGNYQRSSVNAAGRKSLVAPNVYGSARELIAGEDGNGSSVIVHSAGNSTPGWFQKGPSKDRNVSGPLRPIIARTSHEGLLAD